MWNCLCECGNTKRIEASSLKNGTTKSCGCLQKETVKKTATKYWFNPNYKKDRIYRIYNKIKNRCYNSNSESYKYYGGRGIVICDEWLNDFQVFYDWAISSGYDEKLTIDRIDVNGNYEPSNCRWATRKEQNYNKRNNRKITYNEKTQTLTEWAKELNINAHTLSNRINRAKMNPEEAFTKSVHKGLRK